MGFRLAWDQEIRGGSIPPTPKSHQSDYFMGGRKVKVVCSSCTRVLQKDRALGLRRTGKSYQEIGKIFKVDHKTIWNWLN